MAIAVVAISLLGGDADEATGRDAENLDVGLATSALATTGSTAPPTTPPLSCTASGLTANDTTWRPQVYQGAGDYVISPSTGRRLRLIHVASQRLLFPDESARRFGVRAHGEGSGSLDVLVDDRTPLR